MKRRGKSLVTIFRSILLLPIVGVQSGLPGGSKSPTILRIKREINPQGNPVDDVTPPISIDIQPETPLIIQPSTPDSTVIQPQNPIHRLVDLVKSSFKLDGHENVKRP